MVVGMTCCIIPIMLLAIWTSDSGFSDPPLVFLTLLGGPLALGVMLALLLGVCLSWSEWLPAWRVSSILTALGRPDLCARDFADALDDAERTGRLRDTDVGRIYYA